jgi:hypothetical protein
MAAPVAKGGGYKPTDFGLALLGSGGLDPFLEDIRTLWLIHWKLPHLQGGIIDDQETAIRALNELVAEMNHRYTVLKENKVSQLTEEDIRACLEYAANRERRLVTVTS